MHSRRAFIKQAAIAGATVGLSRQFAVAAAAAGDPDATRALRASLTGRLILPGDDDYEMARRVVYVNPRNDMHPVMIARCARPDDVARCVEFARTHELPVAVRSGGHSFLGWGTCNGGLVIDTSMMKDIAIDAAKRTAQVGSGVIARDLVAAAAQHGLVPVLGECPTVGVAGLTLGGGVGWLSGKYGAACDNLMSANLITADARTVAASAEINSDLFWGLRGGGGNFGVATSFGYRLHPVGDVLAGGFTYPVRDARNVLRFFREFMAAAPDELQTLAYLTSDGVRVLNVIFVYVGDLHAGKQLIDRFRAFATPVRDTVQRRDYIETFSMPPYGEGTVTRYGAIKGTYVEQLSDAVIDTAIERFARAPAGCLVGFDHYMHGEVCRVAPDSTAFELRAPGALHAWLIQGWDDPSAATAAMTWADETSAAFRPFAGGRMYANYPNAEGEPAAKATYGAHYSRLASLKKKYDPTNLFRRNVNIEVA